MERRGSRKFIPPDLEVMPEETWMTFKARLRPFDRLWRGRIEFAYDFAKDLYRQVPPRKSGGEFFEHPRAAAIILLDECGIRDPRLIIAALFHDVVEDTVAFGYYEGVTYSDGVRVARGRLEPLFGKKVTDIVIAMTKPKVDGKQVLNREQALDLYFRHLKANPDALLVKMADRLHNLRDVKGLSYEEKLSLIVETRTRYFDLFEGARRRYPKETEYLLSQMREAIAEIEKGFIPIT